MCRTLLVCGVVGVLDFVACSVSVFLDLYCVVSFVTKEVF